MVRGKRAQVDLEEKIAESENEADEAVQQEAEAERGKNSTLTDDERRALLFHHRRMLDAAEDDKRAAAAVVKAAKEKARAELGKNVIGEIEDLRLLDTPAGEKMMREEIERRLRVARITGAAVGTQFSLLEDYVDRTPAFERARAEGFQAGAKGEICRPPHDASTTQYTHWIAGWHEGQEKLASAFLKLKSDDEVAETELEHVDTSDAPFAMPADEMPATPDAPGAAA